MVNLEYREALDTLGSVIVVNPNTNYGQPSSTHKGKARLSAHTYGRNHAQLISSVLKLGLFLSRGSCYDLRDPFRFESNRRDLQVKAPLGMLEGAHHGARSALKDQSPCASSASESDPRTTTAFAPVVLVSEGKSALLAVRSALPTPLLMLWENDTWDLQQTSIFVTTYPCLSMVADTMGSRSSKKLNVDSPSFTPSSIQSSPSGAPLAPAKKTTFSTTAASAASFVPRATGGEYHDLLYRTI